MLLQIALLLTTCHAWMLQSPLVRPFTRIHSDWSGFAPLEDDDDEIAFGGPVDRREYAVEQDSMEDKAIMGATLEPPTIDFPAEPIQVPPGECRKCSVVIYSASHTVYYRPGSQLELAEEIVLGLLSACRYELGTLFGYTAENRGVGITGGVDFVGLDGPTVVIRLKGRFWHERTTVLDRVGNYLQQRVPEIVDVVVEDPWQLTDEANEVW